MPHDVTWFHLLLGKSYPKLEHAAAALSWPVNAEGKTWIGGEPIGIGHMLGAALAVLILLLVGLRVTPGLRDTQASLLPEARLSLRTTVEILVSATYGMMKDVMGDKAARFFLPLIGTCALFILVSNLLGLVPGLVPPTDKLSTTLACSLVVFIATQVFGVVENGMNHFKHFLGPIRRWYALPLMAMFLVLELFSHVAVRPGSLAVRLMANMTADHMVLGTFHSFSPYVAFVVPVLVYLLGTLVCVVQTLVFCLLSTTYIAMAISHEAH
ncbi:MAG: F0F1 ATP synthase subunit A [Polyangiales bacterium]